MSIRQQRREARRLTPQKSDATDSRPSPPVKSVLKSGLDPESQSVLSETREEFAQLGAEYYDHFHPRNPEERFQVDNLIRNEWFLRRFFRVEGHLWEYHTMLAAPSACQLGEAFSKASPIFMRLQRRITLAEKAYKDAKAELERLEALPQPEETTVKTQQLGSFLTPPSEVLEAGQALPPANRPKAGNALDNLSDSPLD